jgi:tetratricopeptide (TPR) repeat protein
VQQHARALVQVWVNLGSIHLARDEPDEAARMYAAALSRFYSNQDPKILLWLARAQYDMKRVAAAKRTLLKALHICPHDVALLFNAALCMQQFASWVRAAFVPRRSANMPALCTGKSAAGAVTEVCRHITDCQLAAVMLQWRHHTHSRRCRADPEARARPGGRAVA